MHPLRSGLYLFICSYLSIVLALPDCTDKCINEAFVRRFYRLRIYKLAWDFVRVRRVPPAWKWPPMDEGVCRVIWILWLKAGEPVYEVYVRAGLLRHSMVSYRLFSLLQLRTANIHTAHPLTTIAIDCSYLLHIFVNRNEICVSHVIDQRTPSIHLNIMSIYFALSEIS